MNTKFCHIANIYRSDIPCSPDLYELIKVEYIPGRTSLIATIRLVTGMDTREISVDYIIEVPDDEAGTILCDLLEELLRQADIVGKSVDRLFE